MSVLWFVYDGDASDTASTGSTSSGVVEDVFVDYFGSIDRATEPTAFDGRSDYDAFVAAGIPAGGLFTGAEDIKTAEQAAKWGGTAGAAFDPCCHAACDTFANVNLVALDEMTDAIAHAILTFGMTTSAVQGTEHSFDLVHSEVIGVDDQHSRLRGMTEQFAGKHASSARQPAADH